MKLRHKPSLLVHGRFMNGNDFHALKLGKSRSEAVTKDAAG